MSGTLPKIVIILLAVGTYASLAFVIMRFALRGTRGPDIAAVAERRHRSALPAVAEPAPSVFAALRQTGLEPPSDVHSPAALAASPPPPERARVD